MVLMEIIQKKLAKKEKQQKIDTLLPILARLSDEKYRPSPDDCIMNTELSDLKTVAEKRRRYNSDLEKGVNALLPGGSTIPLGSDGAKFNDVDLLGGLWRVQKPFDARGYEMVEIRDNKFVILRPINWREYTGYSYYDAASVRWGAFGLDSDFSPKYIVAKAVNEYGTFYSFRCKITNAKALEDARAYLACKVEQARYLAKQKQELTENTK